MSRWRLLFFCVALGFANLLWANTDYQRLCAVCHGQPSEPGIAPSLYGTVLARSDFMQTLRNGRGPMPEFTPLDISDAAANTLYDYLRTASTTHHASSSAQASSVGTHNPANRNRNLREQLSGVHHSPASLNADVLHQDPFAPPALYRKYCAACHGAIDAAVTSAPLKNNPLLDNTVYPDLRFMKLKEPDFTRLVLNGRALMPGFQAEMNDSHTFFLYEWILKQRPANSARATCRPEPIQQTHKYWGRQLYAMYCSRCHGADGQGTGETAGRRVVPAFNRSVLPGHIRYKTEIGHDIAPAHPSLSESDLFQLSHYVIELMGGAPPPSGQSPEVYRTLNGAKCQEVQCASLAQAADDKIAQNNDPLQTPNAGTLECDAWQKKNKRKGPAGPEGLYPPCWGQAEVDKFEQFCKDYSVGIARSYPQNRRVEAQVTTAVANTQLRSPWSTESAVLTCKTGTALHYNLVQPNERNNMPNWRMRIYAPLVEKNAKQNFPEGACWWENPKQTLGAGNPQAGSFANQITLLVRLPDNGRIPGAKFWNGRHGLEDEDKPLTQFSKTERPMYEMLRVYRAQKGQFSLRVYRNLDHDKTRKPNACASCGNSEFTNAPWAADATTQFP